MGEQRQLICEDCKEYADVGKDLTFRHPSFGNPDVALAFIDDHQCCTLRLVGEYSGEDKWMEASTQNGWEKYD